MDRKDVAAGCTCATLAFAALLLAIYGLAFVVSLGWSAGQ